MGRPAKPPKNGKRKQSKRPSGRLTALILAALLLGLSLRLYDLLRSCGTPAQRSSATPLSWRSCRRRTSAWQMILKTATTWI